MSKWVIDKQFDFCYGHRVWSQQLNADYCATGDASCKCRHNHGHQGLVHIFLEGDELTRGMVTDFKHLGWLKNFLDDNLDHKFILDRNDPIFEKIIDGKLSKADWAVEGDDGNYHIDRRDVLDIEGDRILELLPAYVPGTEMISGYNLDVSKLEGAEQEFYEGYFIVDFLPTSENLSKWVFDCAAAKMSMIDVTVSQVDWFETPKSRSSYRG